MPRYGCNLRHCIDAGIGGRCSPGKPWPETALIGQGWSGGTRIGASLAEFNKRTQSRSLSVTASILGRKSYEPRAAGMAAALPYLDRFAPAHNLESLAALEDELAWL